jgi:anti-sigma regulatory factor (Ser/Thr protein kinase)
MTPVATLTHEAFIFDSDDEFVATLTPYLREGLAHGHGLVAAVTHSNLNLLRESLGADAAEVTLIDRDDWYRRPSTTVAGWTRLLHGAKARGCSFVRIIGEVAFGSSEHHATWARYEAALNSLFAESPAWIICPYDTRRLPDTVVSDARRTHPGLAGPVRGHSRDYQQPDEFFNATPEPLPAVVGPPVAQLPLDTVDSIAIARRLVRRIAEDDGWAGLRLDEALLVLTEIVSNSFRHGTGRRELRVWTSDGSLVGEVTDEGPGLPDPLLGYRPVPDTAAGGRGLWISHQLCDRLVIHHDGGITRARFVIER